MKKMKRAKVKHFLQLNSKIFTVKPIQVWSLLFYRFIIILPYTQNIHVKF